MNRELIKDELVSKIESLLKLSENKINGDVSGVEKMKAMADHMGKADNFLKTIIDKLNEILEKNKIEFENEDNKTDFINFISPTVQDLIGKFILNN